MTTSPPVRIVADCSVGGPTDGITEVPLTQAELDQQAKDALAWKAQQDAIAAQQQADATLKASIGTKLNSNPQQALSADEVAYLARVIG